MPVAEHAPPPITLHRNDRSSPMPPRSPTYSTTPRAGDARTIVSHQAEPPSPPKPVPAAEPPKPSHSSLRSSPESEQPPTVEVAEEPIDMEIFQQILELDEDDDDRDFSKGMVEAYFTQAEETFEKLDKALKQSDLATLSDLGHFLKGSSAALGVFRVQAECEKIQNLGKLAHHDEKKNEVKDVTEEVALEKIRESLVTVKGEYAAAEKWLRTYYNDPTDEDS